MARLQIPPRPEQERNVEARRQRVQSAVWLPASAANSKELGSGVN
jgi:hypothetical protein